MNKDVTYTHYGCTKFDKEKFRPIKNRDAFIKPYGGFWASRTDAEYGWKDWNENNCYSSCDENNRVVFKLTENARVLELHSVMDAKMMKNEYQAPNTYGLPTFGFIDFIDFEGIAKDYDAIEFFLSDDGGLYDEMYGWDCDSILILNPDVVKQIEIEKNIADNILEDEMKDVSFVTENDKEKSL